MSEPNKDDRPTGPTVTPPDQPTVVEESFELSPEAEESIATKMADKVIAGLESKKEKEEDVIRKDLGGDAGRAEDKSVELKSVGKERRLVQGIKALMNNDSAALKSINEANINEMDAEQKYAFQNETTNADGGYLVPPADFVADVARLEQQYGVAIRDARIIRTNNNTVLLNKKASGVSMVEMTSNNNPTGSMGIGTKGETQRKTGTKMTFGQDSVTLRKFAAIAAVSDELLEDAAVNIYNELTIDFARESARWQDRLVFTDSGSGLAAISGTYAITSGTVIDQMIQAMWAVPTDAANGGKFYIARSRFGGILQAKDTQGRYLITPGAGGSGLTGTTLWGPPYEVVEVLEEFGQRNTIIFGNLKYVVLVIKNGLQLTTLREGTVHDADGNALNLAEQDMTALRAVIRMVAVCQFPAAFAKLTAGTVS